MTWPNVVWWALSVIASYVISRVTASSGPSAPPGELEGTTVDASSPVPVLFGTRLMAQPNCIWYGDVFTTAIKSSGGKK